MLERVRLLESKDEGREALLPKGHAFLSDVCYKDGSPVIFSTGYPLVIKVGKRKLIKVVFTE